MQSAVSGRQSLSCFFTLIFTWFILPFFFKYCHPDISALLLHSEIFTPETRKIKCLWCIEKYLYNFWLELFLVVISLACPSCSLRWLKSFAGLSSSTQTYWWDHFSTGSGMFLVSLLRLPWLSVAFFLPSASSHPVLFFPLPLCPFFFTSSFFFVDQHFPPWLHPVSLICWMWNLHFNYLYSISIWFF